MPDHSAELIARASRGDVPSIDKLLERHLSGLHAFLRLQAGELLRRKESCSDLVQSVCREVLQDLGGFEYRGEAAFRQWLFTAAQRKLIDRHRFYKQQRRDAGREVSPATAVGSSAGDADVLGVYRTFCTPSKDAMLREELARVEAAFEALTPEYRQVITLARIVGLPHKEIAAQMGRTEVATRHLLARALARLGSVLDVG
jgi:RNA polymerase sigma-70 factor (ECF subfamily)